MSEEDYIPLYKPPLRRHRLVRAGDADSAFDAPAAGQGLTIGSSFPDATPPAPLLAAQAKLAEKATRLEQEVMPGLEALQTALAAQGAAEKTRENLLLVCSALHVLPGELTSGASASVARVDWIFARLLNAPGKPGLIELVLMALLALNAPDSSPDKAAQQELLRRLHRELVSLQQGWEDMLELTLPPEFFEAAAPVEPAPGDEAATTSDEARAAPAPMMSAPLPSGSVVAHPPVAGAKPPMRWRPAALSTPSPLLLMVLIVLVLALTGAGVYMVQNLRGQPADSNNAAVIAQVPSPTARATTQPTVAPTATATATPLPSATSTPAPRPTATNTPAPTATPSPTLSLLCTSGSNLCASVNALNVPCAGQNVTFQLSNNGKPTLFWTSISSVLSGVALVSVSPSGGSLKSGRSVTVTVSARARGQGLTGTLTILAGFGNNQTLVINLHVC